MKKCRIIFSIFLLLLCLSFSGCTDRRQGDAADGSSSQDAPKDIVISDDTDEQDTADSDDLGTGAEDGVTVGDSFEVPDTEVEFSE